MIKSSLTLMGVILMFSPVYSQLQETMPRMFNPQSVITLTGTIEQVMEMPMENGQRGIHLLLNTGMEIIDVHLGPAWYLHEQEVDLEQTDMIEVRGSRVSSRGQAVLIAVSLEKDARMVQIRDDVGMPLWMRKGGG